MSGDQSVDLSLEDGHGAFLVLGLGFSERLVDVGDGFACFVHGLLALLGLVLGELELTQFFDGLVQAFFLGLDFAQAADRTIVDGFVGLLKLFCFLLFVLEFDGGLGDRCCCLEVFINVGFECWVRGVELSGGFLVVFPVLKFILCAGSTCHQQREEEHKWEENFYVVPKHVGTPFVCFVVKRGG